MAARPPGPPDRAGGQAADLAFLSASLTISTTTLMEEPDRLRARREVRTVAGI
jgi:hypothetical protein